MRFWRKILLPLLAFWEVLVLREGVATGASGRLSSHGFKNWCLPVLERRAGFSLVLTPFNSWGWTLYLSFWLNTSKGCWGAWMMGEVFATQLEKNLLNWVTCWFQLSEAKAGGTFSIQFPLLAQSHLLTSLKSTASSFGSLQSGSFATSMVQMRISLIKTGAKILFFNLPVKRLSVLTPHSPSAGGRRFSQSQKCQVSVFMAWFPLLPWQVESWLWCLPWLAWLAQALFHQSNPCCS